MTAPGPRNLITDVAGIAVGNAGDEGLLSGVTVVLPEEAAVAAVDTRGGGPATRETDALDPACLVDAVHGVVLSGGSVFGLDAASGVTHWLDARGRGFRFGEQPHVSPVVPAACLFDFLNGGDKAWGDAPPYRALGLAACDAAAADFALGNAGAGLGAIAGRYKGGLGSASVVAGGVTVGALMAVNAFGSPVVPGTDVLWAAPYGLADELGERAEVRMPVPAKGHSLEADSKLDLLEDRGQPGRNTTIGVVATDALLTPAQARRVAIMATDGMARALRPVHTPFDGDLIFVLATGKGATAPPGPAELSRIGALAADTVARAIARGVFEAETVARWKSFRDIHGI